MGLFSKLRKKQTDIIIDENSSLGDIAMALAEKGTTPLKDENHNCFGEPLDKLTKEGKLPFGWFTAHPDALEKEKPIKDYIDKYVYLMKQNAPIDQQLVNLKKISRIFRLFQRLLLQ